MEAIVEQLNLTLNFHIYGMIEPENESPSTIVNQPQNESANPRMNNRARE